MSELLPAIEIDTFLTLGGRRTVTRVSLML